jgi:hypothetical protein
MLTSFILSSCERLKSFRIPDRRMWLQYVTCLDTNASGSSVITGMSNSTNAVPFCACEGVA